MLAVSAQLTTKKQQKTITKEVNLWFKNERSNGFKFWALTRAITTNGDNEVLAKDEDFEVRNVQVRICPAAEFEPHESEGGGYQGFIHKSRKIIDQSVEVESEVQGGEEVEEVQGNKDVVGPDSLTESSDIPDNSRFLTYQDFPTYANIPNQDPKIEKQSSNEELLQQ